MAYNLNEINQRVKSDPMEFLKECDERYHKKVLSAADSIAAHLKESRIVLLSGPSGSGKTTTARQIEEALADKGIHSYTVSMDNYFRNVDPETSPRNAQRDLDFESPLCLDLELLNSHFDLLERGEEILVPKFSFTRQIRDTSRVRPIRLAQNEVAIFEGIHALNDIITDRHPNAQKLYISARSNVENEGKLCFKGTWMRLVRRSVRDYNFRGADVAFTMKLWSNVRRGEKLYISPYKMKADIIFDSSLPYEVSVMKNYAVPLFADVPAGTPRKEELDQLLRCFDLFEPIDPQLVHPDSLLREFIGGSRYYGK